MPVIKKFPTAPLLTASLVVLAFPANTQLCASELHFKQGTASGFGAGIDQSIWDI